MLKVQEKHFKDLFNKIFSQNNTCFQTNAYLSQTVSTNKNVSLNAFMLICYISQVSQAWLSKPMTAAILKIKVADL